MLRIPWWRYRTAYGLALRVPLKLLALRHARPRRATRAGAWLQNALCHQHAYVSTAALPAAPLVIETLRRPEPGPVAEALDILRGFAVCTAPDLSDAPPWHAELRALVAAAIPTVRSLARSDDEEVASLATLLLEELA